jgi:hypothetical protein
MGGNGARGAYRGISRAVPAYGVRAKGWERSRTPTEMDTMDRVRTVPWLRRWVEGVQGESD